MQLAVDYIIPHLTLNATASLASNPIVDVAASTGRADLFVGGQFAFNSSKNEVTSWTVGAGASLILSWLCATLYFCFA